MRRVIFIPCLLFALTATARQPVRRSLVKAAEPATPNSQLPVTRVALYKNGVGFFEHSGRVTGNQSVTIDFTTAQLNDVLQSLTAIDLNGGRIAGADYNSTTPLEQQLKALPLGLGEDPSAVDFYNAIRGARVEVRSGTASITGRLLNIEVVNQPGKENEPATEKRIVTVIGDAGEIRTVDLTPATSVRLLDSSLHADVARYLELLASTRNQGLRHLTLEDNGTGARELHVSYISEVPIWKSTYRILFTDAKSPKQTATLQGWSVVDNTTGSDWNNVQLSLIAGAPQSFIQPLSIPYYSRRPEIPLPQEAQLSPQTHESGEAFSQGGSIHGTLRDPSGAAIAGAQVTITNLQTGGQTTATTDASGNYSAVLPPGNYSVEFSSPGFQRYKQSLSLADSPVQISPTLEIGSVSQTVTVAQGMAAGIGGGFMGGSFNNLKTPAARAGAPIAPMMYEQIASDSLRAQATSSTFDDYFAYNISEPITIRKNESALVPILQTKVDAERVTLWSQQQPTPLRALWITNTSNLTLDRGSFTIVENGAFGGEGLLEPIHPTEKRLLSYAVDQAVRVSVDNSHSSRRVRHISIAKGILIQSTTDISEIEYLIHNAAPEPRSVIIERPVRNGWTIDSDPKPIETTGTVNRFRAEVQPNESVRLHIGERHPGDVTYSLSNIDEHQFTFILSQSDNNAALKQALQPILDAHRHLADLQTEVDKINQHLNSLRSDEERQRANVTALNNADKSARERFVHDLNNTEDQIAAAQKDLATAQANVQAAQADLENKVESLQMNQDL